MRRVRGSRNELVLHQSAFGMYVLGGVFALVGVFLLLTSATATLTCDRAADSCTLERKSLVRGDAETFRLADIDRAEVYEYSSSDGNPTYSLALETGGEVVFFLSGASNTGAKEQQTADEINAFLADPEAASLTATRDDRGVLFLFAGIFGGTGLIVLLLWAGPVTVTFDRFGRTITRTAGGRLRRSSVTLTFDDVVGVAIVESKQKAGGVYGLFLRRSSGAWFQLDSAYTQDLPAKRSVAEDIRTFLELPPVEEELRPTFKKVREQIKEAVAQREEWLREAATDLAKEGEGTRRTGGSAITRLTANLPTRALAVLVDSWAISMAVYALTRVGLMLSVSVTIVAFGYYTYFEGRTGATLGKRIFGMRVVQLDGSPITWRQAVIRNGVRFIDAIGFYLVGGLLAKSSPTRQRLGDRVAGTVVVWRHAPPAKQGAAQSAARAPDARRSG